MKNKSVFFILILFLYACHHIDDTRYENIYFQDLKKDLSIQMQTDAKKQENLKIEHSPQNITLPTKSVLNETEKIEIKPQPSQISKKTKKRKIKIGELTIESDSMTFNKETSVAVFLDNVKLKAQGVNLSCNSLKSVNYRDNAEATGDVRVNYPQQKVKIICNRVKYNKAMSKIEAYENVIVEKILDNNEKINLFADEIRYDIETGEILATRVSRKVKIKFKDIIAFSDRVIYNEITEELELTGNPFAKKHESIFISSMINIDVNKEIIKLKESIWAKLFYSDFEDIKKEVQVEKDSN